VAMIRPVALLPPPAGAHRLMMERESRNTPS
jgi:hypothetical protein